MLILALLINLQAKIVKNVAALQFLSTHLYVIQAILTNELTIRYIWIAFSTEKHIIHLLFRKPTSRNKPKTV